MNELTEAARDSTVIGYKAGYAAGYRAGIERAAKVCEQLWMAGYRGEVSVGFAHRIRALLDEPQGEK